MKESGIYKITNLVNGKLYIGSAINIKHRWWTHMSRLNRNVHSNQHLQNSYNKYGKNNFQYEILFTCPKKDLIRLEQYHIDNYNPEYNICRIAGNTLGVKCSDVTKLKISIANSGKSPSLTTRQLMSLSSKNRKKSLQHAVNISNGSKGKILSEKTKLKISDSKRNVKLTAQHKLKIGLASSKSVAQVCIQTLNIINTFSSVKKASLFHKIPSSNIAACARGIRKTTGGYLWKYIN